MVMGVSALLVGAGLMGVKMAYEADDGLGEFRRVVRDFGMQKIDPRHETYVLSEVSDDEFAKLAARLHVLAMRESMSPKGWHVPGPGESIAIFHETYEIGDEWGWRKVTFDYSRGGYTFLTLESRKTGIGEWIRERISGAKP